MVGAAAALVAAAAAAGAAKRPHIIQMVLDDIGWADVSYRGSDFPTPNIDNLMRTGAVLDRYYVQPVCSPTRSAFMTGRFPHKTGMQHFETLSPGSTAHLPTDHKTLPELLRDNGYDTHMVGKWHLGYARWEYTPVGRGFQTYTGYLQGQVDYYKHNIGLKVGKVGLDGYDFWDNTTGKFQALWGLDGSYTMDHYMQAAQRVISGRDMSKPLYLYYAHQEIHIPIEYPPQKKYADLCAKVPKDVPGAMMNRQALCSMMVDLDDNIGTFVDLLKSSGMWADTLMFFTTDNGGMTHWADIWPASVSSNWPLRGGKTSLFEGGLRGTGFLNGGFLPQKSRGQTVSALMHAVDVAPTLASVAGVDPLDIWDGKDMWGVISGEVAESSEPREIPLNVYERGTNYSALIIGDMKLINGFWGLCDGYWTVGVPYEHQNTTEKAWVKLFNVTADPQERNNLAASMPDVVSRMTERLTGFWANPNNGYMKPQLNIAHIKSYPVLHNGTWAPFDH